VKHDELWWRIMAIDWEGKELLIAVEGAETTPPLNIENDELIEVINGSDNLVALCLNHHRDFDTGFNK